MTRDRQPHGSIFNTAFFRSRIMRDKASLHSVPIVPNPNFAGDLRGYRQKWTVPSVEDLARNRPPLYLPDEDPAHDNPDNSPWKPNYRNEMPRSPDPRSSMPGPASDWQAAPDSSSALAALMALAAPGNGLAANGARGGGAGASVSRPAGPAVLFGLGALPQAVGPGDQTGSGGLLDLLARLMATNPDDQSSPR
ncbi:MAG: hypothetical protein WA418_18690 [Bradyrhizobium sp.]